MNYGAVGVSKLLHGSAGLALVAEIIGTFVLMWAIMGMAVNPRGERALAGLVIGSTLGFAVMAIGPMTGAGFNPARALGPALVANHFGPAGTWLLAYVVGPVIGAGLAGALYTLIVLGPPASGRAPLRSTPCLARPTARRPCRDRPRVRVGPPAGSRQAGMSGRVARRCRPGLRDLARPRLSGRVARRCRPGGPRAPEIPTQAVLGGRRRLLWRCGAASRSRAT